MLILFFNKKDINMNNNVSNLIQVSQEMHFRNHLYFDGTSFVATKQSHNKLLELIQTANPQNKDEKGDVYSALSSIKIAYEKKSSGWRCLLMSSKKVKHYKKTIEIIDQRIELISKEKLSPSSKTAKTTVLIAKLSKKAFFALPKPSDLCLERMRRFIEILEENNIAITGKQFIEIFNGAHVHVEDDKEIYEILSPEYKSRISSHPSLNTQIHKSEGFYGEFLVGTWERGTWFQLEKSPFNSRNPISYITHGFDFLCYRITGMNVGPYGLSCHTDKNPMVLRQAKQPATAIS